MRNYKWRRTVEDIVHSCIPRQSMYQPFPDFPLVSVQSSLILRLLLQHPDSIHPGGVYSRVQLISDWAGVYYWGSHQRHGTWSWAVSVATSFTYDYVFLFLLELICIRLSFSVTSRQTVVSWVWPTLPFVKYTWDRWFCSVKPSLSIVV